MHPYIHCSIIYNRQAIEATQVSTERRVDENECNLAICDNTDGPRGYYAESNKSDREKTNTVWFHLYVESKSKTKQMNKQTHGYREQADSGQSGGGGEGWNKKEKWINKTGWDGTGSDFWKPVADSIHHLFHSYYVPAQA